MHNDRLENLSKGEAISRPAVWITSHGRRRSFLAILLCSQHLSWTAGAFQAIRPVQPRSNRRGKCGVKRLLSEIDPGVASTDKKKQPRDVRFISPLLEYGYLPAVEEHENNTLSQKPLLLFLPGFDGTFLSPFLQFPELHTIFDVRCMTVGMQDRSTFEELKEGVIDFLLSEQYEDKSCSTVNSAELEDSGEEEISVGKGTRIGGFFASRGSAPAKPSPRDVYLIGESFGGTLASEVALTLLGREKSPALKGMALVNAATCYDRSKLASELPALAQLHPFVYPAGLIMKLLPLLTDEHSWDQLLLMLRAEALPSIIDDEIRETYLGRVALSLPTVLKFMPQETLQWRLTEWLETGCTRMASRLSNFQQYQSFQTLIVAGDCDGVLPSIDEAERLAGVFPQALVHVVDGAGHASTCGSRVDLAALFRSHFRELGSPRRQRSSSLRTAMKETAAAGKGKYFGMEPRYDGQTIGISPLKYWSRKYYRKVQPTSANTNATKATASDE